MRVTYLLILLALLAAPAAADQAPRVAVSQEAPAFSLPGSDGETYSLGELRGEKDLVLIFFRGTW